MPILVTATPVFFLNDNTSTEEDYDASDPPPPPAGEGEEEEEEEESAGYDERGEKIYGQAEEIGGVRGRGGRQQQKRRRHQGRHHHGHGNRSQRESFRDHADRVRVGLLLSRKLEINFPPIFSQDDYDEATRAAVDKADEAR